MLLVTGASGAVGGRVAALTAESGGPLRLMARDPSKVAAPGGAEVVAGDYAAPETLPAAFDGVDTAFIVSGYAREGDRAALHRNAIVAAAAAGVRRLVYLSFQGAAPTSKFPMARDHALTEGFLRESGLPFTALRDNLYLDVLPHLFGEDGVVRGPAGEGAAAYVAREDVARTAAATLTGDWDGQRVLDVTGPEALTFPQVVTRLSALVGRPLAYVDETLEEARRWRAASGAPDWEVETWLGSYLATAAGELEAVSDTVARVTGRAPMSLEAYFSATPSLLDPLRAG